MIKHFCNRCGKEESHYFAYRIEAASKYYDLELCLACKNKFELVLKEWSKGES